MQVQFERREQGREAVGIFEFERLARVEVDAEAIFFRWRVKSGEIEAGGMDPLHDDLFIADEDGGFGSVRKPGANFGLVWAKDGKGVVVAAFYNCFKLGSVHHS